MKHEESRWLVEGPDGGEIGPISTRAVAQAILAGDYPYEVRVAAPHATPAKKWLRAVDVPVIADIVENEPTIITTDLPVQPPVQDPVVPTAAPPVPLFIGFPEVPVLPDLSVMSEIPGMPETTDMPSDSGEIRTPRTSVIRPMSDSEPCDELDETKPSQPPTRPATAIQSPPTTRPYRRYDETVASPGIPPKKRRGAQ